MAISGTKYMHEVYGSADNAGTASLVPRNLIGAVLDVVGTNLHYQNHGYEFTAGDALNLYEQEEDGTATLGIYEITAATTDDIAITPSAAKAGATETVAVNVNIGGAWPPGYPAYATGSGDLGESFGLHEPWTLTRAFCRFLGSPGRDDLALTLNSGLGTAYSLEFYRLRAVGVGRAAVLRMGTTETGAPSAWSFQAGDLVSLTWTNPGGITWGLQVSMTPTRLLETWNYA